MSWGLFISGIMAGVLAVWIVVEKAKYEIAENERIAREIDTRKTYEPVTVPTMTEEEFNTKMDTLFEIFAIKEEAK